MELLIKKISSIEPCTEQKPEYIEDKRWENIQNIKHEADKRRSLVSGYLLWSMCQKLQIKNPIYGYSYKGKPYLEETQNFAFNISHSGEYAVLAYHKAEEPIGVDIQQIKPLYAGIERRILHEKEIIPLTMTQEEKIQYLNRIWSAKESYVKMTGEGLACDFRNIYVDFENGFIREDGKDETYFFEISWKSGYVLMVCTLNQVEIQIEEI